jgi:RNA polymerase sigma-70 factor (ECF subfamily)
MAKRPERAETPLDRLYLEIYARELDYVSRQLRRLGVRAADLPDVAQDVFMVVRRRLADFDATRPVRPWLFGVLFRVASDRSRRSQNAFEILPGAQSAWIEGEDPRPRPDEALIDRQARLIAREVLDSLDPRLRVVLELHDLAEVPANEVAIRLGIPLKTVYTRLRLARARFAGAANEAGPRRRTTPGRGLASVA